MATALSMAMDPEGFFEACRQRRGDPFVVGMPTVGEVLVSGEPEAAKELFSASPDTFEPLKSNPVEPLLGTHSLLLLAGERHRRERKLMNPPFHGDRMRAYGAIIRDRAVAERESWRTGELVVLQKAMRGITLDVILRAVLGIEGDARVDRMRRAVAAMLDAYTPPLLVLPALRRSIASLGPWAKFAAARDSVRELFAEEIAERRRKGTAGREDILSLLMDARYDDGAGLTENELIDELRTLIVGGHDTTMNALVWTFVLLHRDPAVLRVLREELEPLGPRPDAEALAQLPYLGAVCNEALRLHPVVPIVPRRALRPFVFRGYAVEAGQSVAVSTTLLHTNPRIWKDPHGFDPSRFVQTKYTPFEYAPFGGGVRRCIGAAFGAYQMRIVLGTVLAGAKFALHEGPVPARVLSGITMGPRGKVQLRYLGGVA